MTARDGIDRMERGELIAELRQAREEIARLQAAMQWAAFADEPLPLPGQFVLVTDGSRVGYAKLYIGPPPRFCTDEGLDVGSMTHWMPLPSAPKEGERDA